MKRGSQLFLLILSILFVSSCGKLNGQGPAQFAAIVDEVQFDTLACQAQEKKIKYQNPGDQPQAVKWIAFQGGTNPLNYFRIKQATIGNGTQEYRAFANEIKEDQDVVIPEKGVLEITVSYKPRQVTNPRKGEVHKAYLDLFLRDPALGVLQFELTGRAPQKLEGCGEWGTAQTFTVKQVTVTIKLGDAAVPTVILGDQFKDRPFQFYDNNGKATLDGAGLPPSGTLPGTLPGIPPFNIPAPGFPNGVEIRVGSDEYVGTFKENMDGKKELEIENVDFTAAFILHVAGVKVTTGTTTANNSYGAINTSMSLTGSPLNDSGKMKVVFAAPIPDNEQLKELRGGVIGVEMELE